MLKERIEAQIEKEAMKTGAMGTETVSVILVLTQDEMKEYRQLELPANYYYELEGNELHVSYCEEV